MTTLYFVVMGAIGLASLIALFPVRKEPFSILSFTCGWLAGDLSPQLAVAVVAGDLAAIMWLTYDWFFWAGLITSVVSFALLIALARSQRCWGLVAAGLGAIPGLAIAVPRTRPHSLWGTPLRSALAFPSKGRAIRAHRDIAYLDDASKAHRLDVYEPTTATATLRPILLYIHGGAWVIGDKREQGKPMLFEFARQGYVAVTANYRLSPKATWPAHIVDVKAAIAWVKAHAADFGADPNQIVIAGGSAGGHLAALAALTPNDPEFQPGFEAVDTSVRACISCYGALELTGDKRSSGRYGNGLIRLLEREVLKTTMASDPERFKRASPTSRIEPGAPPFLLFQGGNDTLVPVDVARQFVERFTQLTDAPIGYVEFPFAQHAFDVVGSARANTAALGALVFSNAVLGRHQPFARPTDSLDTPGTRT